MSQGFITNHRGDEVDPKQPRIVGLQIDDTGLHFHKINYKKDLIVSLQKKITFGEPGLMTLAEYFEDEALQIPVLKIERFYDIHPITKRLLRKKTDRIYFNEDGTVNEEVKSPGWYVYTPEESRGATHRRRKNVTNQLEDEMLGLIMQGAQILPPDEQLAAIQNGAAFIAEMSPAINTFHLSGNIQAIVDFINYEDPVNSANNTVNRYPFLLAEVAPGVLAKDLIITRLSY